MATRNHALTEVVCRHGTHLTFCLAIERHVPESLACTPVSGSAAGSGTPCECFTNLDFADLQGRANDATRRGWGEWVSHGKIVIHV
jgi:hypothetical protein